MIKTYEIPVLKELFKDGRLDLKYRAQVDYQPAQYRISPQVEIDKIADKLLLTFAGYPPAKGSKSISDCLRLIAMREILKKEIKIKTTEMIRKWHNKLSEKYQHGHLQCGGCPDVLQRRQTATIALDELAATYADNELQKCSKTGLVQFDIDLLAKHSLVAYETNYYFPDLYEQVDLKFAVLEPRRSRQIEALLRPAILMIMMHAIKGFVGHYPDCECIECIDSGDIGIYIDYKHRQSCRENQVHTCEQNNELRIHIRDTAGESDIIIDADRRIYNKSIADFFKETILYNNVNAKIRFEAHCDLKLPRFCTTLKDC